MADKAKTDDLDALAGEYVLGVLSSDERRRFERLVADNPQAALALHTWQNRLAPLNDGYTPVSPPASLKSSIDRRLFATANPAVNNGLWNAIRLWRGLGLAGMAAAMVLALFSANLYRDLGSTRADLSAAVTERNESEKALLAYEGELADRSRQLAKIEEQLTSSNGELAQVRDQLAEARSRQQPLLVVSLESGETNYRFLAVHEEGSDNVRMSLVSGDVESGKDFELWLVEPDKQTVSLGVIESGKTAVSLTARYAEILEAGGLLAVSLEQKGGSPTGVAQGPVIAVGAPQKL
jgi:anti-sigma-K factor RskA